MTSEPKKTDAELVDDAIADLSIQFKIDPHKVEAIRRMFGARDPVLHRRERLGPDRGSLAARLRARGKGLTAPKPKRGAPLVEHPVEFDPRTHLTLYRHGMLRQELRLPDGASIEAYASAWIDFAQPHKNSSNRKNAADALAKRMRGLKRESGGTRRVHAPPA